MSARAARVLTKYDIKTVAELRECWTAAAGRLVASHLPNIGQKTIDEIARMAEASEDPLPEAERRARQAAFPLSRPENQAYAAAQWLSGARLKPIARQFGFHQATELQGALDVFVGESVPQGHRKAATRRALARFLAARDDRALRQVAR